MTDSVLALLPRIADELEARGISYALGGAIALAAHGVPRATADLDFNVFEPETRLGPVFDALEAAGGAVAREECLRRVRDRGDFEVRSRVKTVAWSGRKLPVISAEDLVLFKVLFDRPKDWIDSEMLLAARRGRTDSAYLDRWLTEILPANDARPLRLRALLEKYRG